MHWQHFGAARSFASPTRSVSFVRSLYIYELSRVGGFATQIQTYIVFYAEFYSELKYIYLL